MKGNKNAIAESDAKSDGIIRLLMSPDFNQLGYETVKYDPVSFIDDFVAVVKEIVSQLPTKITQGVIVEIVESLDKTDWMINVLGIHYPLDEKRISLASATHLSCFPDQNLMRSELRQTIVHEIAHLFGVTDEELQGRGLYSPRRDE